MKLKNEFCRGFGCLVRELRERQGLSQEEFAERAQVHRTYIGGIERGERNPTLTTIQKIASALGVEPGRLLTSSSPKK